MGFCTNLGEKSCPSNIDKITLKSIIKKSTSELGLMPIINFCRKQILSNLYIYLHRLQQLVLNQMKGLQKSAVSTRSPAESHPQFSLLRN